MAKKTSLPITTLPERVQGRLEIRDPDFLRLLQQGDAVVKVCMASLRKRLEKEKREAMQKEEELQSLKQSLIKEAEATFEARAVKRFETLTSTIWKLVKEAKIDQKKVQVHVETGFDTWLCGGKEDAAIAVSVTASFPHPHQGCCFSLTLAPSRIDKVAMRKYLRLQEQIAQQRELAHKAQSALASRNRYREDLEAVLAAKSLEGDPKAEQLAAELRGMLESEIAEWKRIDG